jgi:AraC-like DNA-binding protein
LSGRAGDLLSGSHFLKAGWVKNMKERFIFPWMTEMEISMPIYMCGTGYLSHQYPIDRPQGHGGFQWIQCTKGEGVLETGGQTCRVGPGQGMFLFPDEPHRYYAVTEPWEVYWMIMLGNQIGNIARSGGIQRSGVYTIPESEALLTHMRHAYTIAAAGQPMLGLECAKITYMLLLDLIRYSTKHTETPDPKYIRLQPALDYIDTNFESDITLSKLSELLGVSEQHLCLLFRKLLNMRPMEYVNKVRINKSKHLLFRHREKKIFEISRMVGFEDPAYYAFLFKRFEGITPAAFKKMGGT